MNLCDTCQRRDSECPIEPTKPVTECVMHWPKSRGTTHGSLMQMHAAAEEEGVSVTEYCNQCAEKLEDGDTVVRDHDGCFYHHDCWKDGGPPHRLDSFEYQGEPVSEPTTKGPLEDAIRATCAELADFLCAKNRAYGNSVGAPIGIFAKRADAMLAMDVRIDDKLNRLARGSEYPGDDTCKDLCGYLILRMVVAQQGGKK